MEKKTVLVLIAIMGLLFVFGFMYYKNKPRQKNKIDHLSDIVIPSEFANDLDKGYFLRFEDDYVLYKKGKIETKMLLNENLFLIQDSKKITKDYFRSGDIISLRLIETAPGVKKATIITRYP